MPYGDSWFSFDGGNLTAADAKTRPGAMGKEVSAGGLGSRADITLEIQLSDVVATWHKTLENKIGPGRVKVGVTLLDEERAPTGESYTYTGKLKEARLPRMGNPAGGGGGGGTSTIAMYTVIVSADEQAA